MCLMLWLVYLVPGSNKTCHCISLIRRGIGHFEQTLTDPKGIILNTFHGFEMLRGQATSMSVCVYVSMCASRVNFEPLFQHNQHLVIPLNYPLVFMQILVIFTIPLWPFLLFSLVPSENYLRGKLVPRSSYFGPGLFSVTLIGSLTSPQPPREPHLFPRDSSQAKWNEPRFNIF